MLARFITRIQDPTPIIPLIVFRIMFGSLMFISTLRFILNGWVYEFYIAPDFHFKYLWFDWVKPLPDQWMYIPFILMLVASVSILVGFAYHFSIASFFLLFTYVELLDKTYYLNHYYFVSILSFLFIFLPLNRAFSVDARLNPSIRATHVPTWTVWSIRLLLGLVYCFAGLAKLYDDWLLRGVPLSIWLKTRTEFPIIGDLFLHPWFALVMSWAGAIYDLTIPFWLLWKRTRLLAYIAVILFHVMTAMLFPIGMFPWIMIGSTLIFFNECDYRRVYKILQKAIPLPEWEPSSIRYKPKWTIGQQLIFIILGLFFLFQLLMPLRFLLYPGYINWTEQGYRFSWRVMLVEKAGFATFTVVDTESDKRWNVYPSEYLTPYQEKQMSFQPDMILEFAHYVEDLARQQGYRDVAVYADVWVAFNGRVSQTYIDSTVDLTLHENELHNKDWILPLVLE